ncbi:CusB/HlyD membrane fusion family barrel-sandwich protein [Aneurinibacillus soli]|uniref:Putative multidrug resistance protein EmrK n=1 Tax=Aneurinibacillus soli TaxID=1500254 RepID=A0A0U5BCK3_9BACL|nr:efflux RND transporter periplasmic adaptor subunit [Aneurinibacillus soli]PYE61681.1 CusB/HlyD membrane fusion family barrel-sandwich protein [Aneurinibacillus soli]BAU28461.1 putative multidrug resistance protein EmrK [Aneurinibacillus soli]
MSRARFLIMNLVAFLVIILLAIGSYTYYYKSANYITTDDAKVSGKIIPISALTGGKLTDWSGTEGTSFSAGATIGKISSPQESIDITAPIDGTLVQNKVTKGQMVAPGQLLGQMVNMKQLYIEANIEETSIKDVKKGAEVDVTFDVNPNTTFKGKVEQIGLATNSMFSLLPPQNASGNYTKVTQHVPVRISIDSYPAEAVPGMNATIRIHK